MSDPNSVSRRQFVAGASSLLLAGAAQGAGEKTVANPGSPLALHGGDKAVTGGGRFGTPLGRTGT